MTPERGMTRIILKWKLPPSAVSDLWMQPGPALAVAWQRGELMVWVAHDIEARKVVRTFAVLATGEEFPDDGRYIGSAVGDDLVFHVYELSP